MDRPPGFDELSIVHKSDWVRTEYLARYGGVWLDPTVLLFAPVESWLVEGELCGFASLHDVDFIENWAFAAPPGNRLMQLWKDEFRKAITMGFTSYADSQPVKARLGHTRFFSQQMPYLTHQASLIMVANSEPELLRFRKVTGTRNPLHHLQDGREAVSLLLNTRSNPGYTAIKFPRAERNLAANHLVRGWFLDGGYVSKALLMHKCDSDLVVALNILGVGAVCAAVGSFAGGFLLCNRNK